MTSHCTIQGGQKMPRDQHAHIGFVRLEIRFITMSCRMWVNRFPLKSNRGPDFVMAIDDEKQGLSL